MSITLNNITENHPVKAELYFSGAFNTENGVYYSPGMVEISILKNTLNGGYIGNTLLKEHSYSSQNSDNTDLRIGKFLFSKANLIIHYNGIKYTLNSKFNYLHLKAEIKSSRIK